MKRIEVCGGIASGKTTLASLAADAGFAAILEDFGANPFLPAFYQSPKRFAFETEVAFLLQHFHQVKREAASRKVIICDFSFLLDAAYADVTLAGQQRSLFTALRKYLMQRLGPPLLVVNLSCDSRTELRRIRARARPAERAITIRYLDRINEAIQRRLSSAAGPVGVLEINSVERDFASDPDGRAASLADLKRALRRP